MRQQRHATEQTQGTARMAPPWISCDDLQRLLGGVSKRTVYRWVRDDGTFPRPFKLGGLTRWDRSEVLEWVEACKARRDAGARRG